MMKVLFAAVSLVVASSALAATVGQPHLRISGEAPLTVVGRGFKNHEAVDVTYRADRTWIRHATATAAGTFTVRFAGVRFQACKTHRLSAAGSGGTKAFFKMPPVSCSPPPDEP
jgi:hypothetical protein